MPATLLMLPPKTPRTRDWARRLAATLPELSIVLAEDEDAAGQTEAAYGTMPGVLITPHTAGYGPSLDDRRYEVLPDNSRRFRAGQTLRKVVDKSSWL